jgi:hypothetical protein
VSGQLHAPTALTREEAPGTHRIGGWVNPRVGLDDVEKGKFLILPGLELRPLGRPARSQSLYRLGYPGSNSDCIASNYWLTVNNKLESTWKVAVMPTLRSCPGIFPDSLRNTTKNNIHYNWFRGRNSSQRHTYTHTSRLQIRNVIA